LTAAAVAEDRRRCRTLTWRQRQDHVSHQFEFAGLAIAARNLDTVDVEHFYRRHETDIQYIGHAQAHGRRGYDLRLRRAPGFGVPEQKIGAKNQDRRHNPS
jgi:hypothetical protein